MTDACDITILRDKRPSVRLSATGSDAVCHVAVLVFCGAILACSAVLTYREDGLVLSGRRWPFYCWLHETTGIKCALCGLSRSFCALAHGDLHTALHLHRLGPIVFALFCLEIPYRLYALAVRPRRISPWLSRFHAGLITLVGVAVLANWIVYLGGLLL